MIPLTLRITLKSVATFGRGDGLMGVVDREVEQDADGFPYLRGKTLKGLLGEAAENVVYALDMLQQQKEWRAVKDDLFGQPGRGIEERGRLHIGDATLPEQFRIIMKHVYKDPQSQVESFKVFEALTGIRHQTAVNPQGAPETHTLRAMRVLAAGLTLEAPILIDASELSDKQKAFLAALVLDFRRGGTGRNRGRGWLKAEIVGNETTLDWFQLLKKEIPA